MTAALGDPDDTELVDMSARYRAISQRPISTNSAIRNAAARPSDHAQRLRLVFGQCESSRLTCTAGGSYASLRRVVRAVPCRAVPNK